MKVGGYKSNLLEMFSEKLRIDDTDVSQELSTTPTPARCNTIGAKTPVFNRNGDVENTKLAFEEFLKHNKEIATKHEKSLSQKNRTFLKLNEKDNINKTALNSVTNTALLKGDKSSDSESRLRRNLHKPYSNRQSRCIGNEEENEGACMGHGTEQCDHVEPKKCDCTYCAVFGTVHKNAELRDRLRVRLHQRREKRSKDVSKQNLPTSNGNIKAKNVAANRVETRVPLPSSPTNIPSAPSISSNESLGIGAEIPSNSDIHGILNYIEGNTGLNKQELAEKKAAKKARQRARKDQERIEAEEEEKRKLKELQKKEEERKRELEQKLLEQKKLEAALKKKEKKRKQAIKRQGGVEVIEETVPALITIKRTSDDNIKPSVFITLKGYTPDQETLLCTLIDKKPSTTNMQEITNSKSKKKKNQVVTKPLEEPLIVSKDINITVAVDKNCSNKKLELLNIDVPKPHKNTNYELNSLSLKEINTLGNLRLPPGITITKVDGPVSNRNYITSDPPKSSSVVGKSGVIVVDTDQLTQKNSKDLNTQSNQTLHPHSNPKTSKRSRNKKNKNNTQINSTTHQKQQQNDKPKMVTLKNPIFQQFQPSTKPVADQCAPAAIFTSENGMVTIRSSRLQQSLENSLDNQPQGTTVSSNIWKNSVEPWANGAFSNPNPYFPEMNSPNNLKDSPVEKPKDAQEILSGLPGIEITKLDKNCVISESGGCEEAQVTLHPPVNGTDEELQFDKDDWLYDSVFKPRDVLEDDMDAEELELEAFKRFCSQSVPPKQKEKVAHLNVADIFWKKEAEIKFT